MIKRLWIVAAVLLAACGQGSDAIVQPSDKAEVKEFCDRWDAALTAGDDGALTQALKEPPAELSDDADKVRAAPVGGRASDEVSAAAGRVSRWVETNCIPEDGPDGPAAAGRRLAPPAGTDLGGLVLCQAGGSPGVTPPASDGVVLYGQVDRPDPYAGPMLGVLWSADQGHAGDGDTTPVKVRGLDGVAAPITVFQQVILPQLGTVIAWEEAGLHVGLYGRLFDSSRVAELVAVADSLILEDGSFHFPEGAMPSGYGQVFAGQAGSMSALFPSGAGYQVHYQAPKSAGDEVAGTLQLSAFVATPEEAEAYRFLAVSTERTDLDGRAAMVGDLWNMGQGPAAVSWREPDGLTIRLVGIGIDLDAVKQAATATRELSRAEWTALVSSTTDCYEQEG